MQYILSQNEYDNYMRLIQKEKLILDAEEKVKEKKPIPADKKRKLLTLRQRKNMQQYNGKPMKIVPTNDEKRTAIGYLELGQDGGCSYVKPMIINTSALKGELGYDVYV